MDTGLSSCYAKLILLSRCCLCIFAVMGSRPRVICNNFFMSIFEVDGLGGFSGMVDLELDGVICVALFLR